MGNYTTTTDFTFGCKRLTKKILLLDREEMGYQHINKEYAISSPCKMRQCDVYSMRVQLKC